MSQQAPPTASSTGASRSRRSDRAHQAILAATTELLTESGYNALTIEGVAARAGVGKTTVYRWWPTKGALAIEAISTTLPTTELTDTGVLRRDLLEVIRGIMQIFTSTPAGSVLPALAADLVHDPQLAEQLRDQLIRPRRAAVRQILGRAEARGELPSGVDTELLVDVYAGAVFYRLLVSGEPVTDVLAEQLVELLLDGKLPITSEPGRR